MFEKNKLSSKRKVVHLRVLFSWLVSLSLLLSSCSAGNENADDAAEAGNIAQVTANVEAEPDLIPTVALTATEEVEMIPTRDISDYNLPASVLEAIEALEAVGKEISIEEREAELLILDENDTVLFEITETEAELVVIDAEGDEVLFEQVNGEWVEKSDFIHVTDIEKNAEAFVEWDRISDFRDWVDKHIIPTVPESAYVQSGTEPERWTFRKTSFYIGSPIPKAIGIAFFSTEMDGQKYVGVVNAEKDPDGIAYSVFYVIDPDFVHRLDKFDAMSDFPVVLSIHRADGERDPLVEEGRKYLGEEIDFEDIREYLPEDIADKVPEGVDPPSGAMFAYFSHLGDDWLRETYPLGTGGLDLAAYFYLRKADSSYFSVGNYVALTFIEPEVLEAINR